MEHGKYLASTIEILFSKGIAAWVGSRAVVAPIEHQTPNTKHQRSGNTAAAAMFPAANSHQGVSQPPLPPGEYCVYACGSSSHSPGEGYAGENEMMMKRFLVAAPGRPARTASRRCAAHTINLASIPAKKGSVLCSPASFLPFRDHCDQIRRCTCSRVNEHVALVVEPVRRIRLAAALQNMLL